MKLKIVERQLDELKPYENNPRINNEAVEPVAKSISEFGFKVPIIVDRDGVIIAGHTRYKAAHLLGLEKVPCIVADDLTPEQIKAFRLADNKTAEFAEWDFELLAAELDELTAFDIDMDDLGFYSILEDSDFDHLFEPQLTTQTKPVSEKEQPAQQPQNDNEPPEDDETKEPAARVFRVIVTLDSEDAMREMIERLNNEGYEAREW